MLADDGDYSLVVEVNREFDQNASYRPLAYEDRMLTENGFTQTGLISGVDARASISLDLLKAWGAAGSRLRSNPSNLSGSCQRSSPFRVPT